MSGSLIRVQPSVTATASNVRHNESAPNVIIEPSKIVYCYAYSND
jgi:hypothetical protein